ECRWKGNVRVSALALESDQPQRTRAPFSPERVTCAVPNRVPLLAAVAVTSGGGGVAAWLVEQVGRAIDPASKTCAAALMISLFVFVTGLLATAVAWIARPMSRRSGLVSVDATALRFRGKPLVKRNEIEVVVSEADRGIVRIICRGELAAE